MRSSAATIWPSRRRKISNGWYHSRSQCVCDTTTTVGRAADPGLTFDATKQDFLDRRFDLWNANYPSLYVPQMGATLTVARTFKNELAKTTKFKLTIQAPADLGITVPVELVVDPGAFATFDITLNASAVPSGEVRHAVLLIKGKTIARFPITIVKS